MRIHVILIAISLVSACATTPRNLTEVRLNQLPTVPPVPERTLFPEVNTHIVDVVESPVEPSNSANISQDNAALLRLHEQRLTPNATPTRLRTTLNQTVSPSDRLRVIRLRQYLYNAPEFEWTYSLFTNGSSTERTGSCIEFSAFVIAHARELGLEAEFVYVEQPPIWTNAGAEEWLSIHHIAARVKADGQWFDFDITGYREQTRQSHRLSDQEAYGLLIGNEAARALIERDMIHADALARESVRHFPSHAGLWSNLALIHAERSERDARLLFGVSINQTYAREVALSNYEQFLKQRDDREGAQLIERQLAEYRSSHPYYLRRQASEALISGRPHLAVERLEQAIEAAPNAATLYYALAAVHDFLGETEQSNELKRTAHSIDSGQSSNIFDRKQRALATLFNND